MTPINPWLMMKAGKMLGEMSYRVMESRDREETALEKERKRKKEEKEQKKREEKWAEEIYKREHPTCTWMFNHFTADYECAINDDYSWKSHNVGYID